MSTVRSQGTHATHVRPFRRCIFCISFVLLCVATIATAQPLTQLQYHLTGLGLDVFPSALTVPRSIATQLNTRVVGGEALPAGAIVKATLRGPSFLSATTLTATPGQPILLPAFTQPGTHFLEDIHVEASNGFTLPASPTTVTINVIDKVLAGAVSSRPLTLEEIRALGIQFDENSFQAFAFTIAFTTESGVINLEVPVLIPVGTNTEEQMLVGSQIPGIQLDQLPGLQFPNLGVEPIMLDVITDLPPGEKEKIPPIPGIIIIPGNVAFLNQFFSVLLTVSNLAPDGTPLVVRDLRAEISLPAGADGVKGDILRDPPFRPGEPEFDNPLRLAKTAAGRQNTKPVLAPGPDGQAGTTDDVDRLRPQGSGTAEFLVEGIKEGGHVIGIEIRGTLEGLPSGPVQVVGHAQGAVVVRDPNFALTFIHPDTVRAGERYELLVHIQNTSSVDANLVTVSLDPRNLSGARLVNNADARQVIDTIHAGDSETVTFLLESQTTGRVNASMLELAGAAGVVSGRSIALSAGVSEQGAPLSSDTLILPPAVSFLRQRAGNADLTFRAVALLGEAHSIATAPRGSLPLGVRPIPASIVGQRARELSEAAFRLQLSYRAGADGKAEPLPQGLLLTLEDLYFDFLGAGVADDGWDALYADSRQARLFGAALAEVVGREAQTLGLADLLALQRHWADTESYRADQLTIMTKSTAGEIPVVLDVSDRQGRRLGGSLDPEGGFRDIPRADILRFDSGDVATGQFAVLTRLDASPYIATLVAQHTGTFDLGIVVPDRNGALQQTTFRNMSVTTGERLTVTIRPRSEPLVELTRNGTPVVATTQEPIPDGPPEVLGVVQRADPSVDQFGRVVGILFDEDVDKASAEAAVAYAISTATIQVIPPPPLVDSNKVQNVIVQIGNRIVLLGLRDPVGPFVSRTLDISSVKDLRGQTMTPVKARPILPDPVIGNGAQLTGRVLRADGSPVANAEITYFQFVKDEFDLCEERVIGVKTADAEGRYGLDFVLKDACEPGRPFRIRARDPVSREEGTLSLQVRANGDRMTLDIVLVGRGSVEGIVRNPDGVPQPDVVVQLTSITDLSLHATRTDQNGFYRIAGVPVGPFALEVAGQAGSARASGALPTGDAAITMDITIFSTPANGVVTGIVRSPNGTPAPHVKVFLAVDAGILSATESDGVGAFRFERLTPGDYLVRALDSAAALIGDARIVVTEQNIADNPVSVLVILAGTGSVSGTIFERVGSSSVPVPGALVGGGTQIVTADEQGRYTIPVVPVGVRTIEALNPATGARGEREVTILTAGQVSTGIDIVLQPLGTVTGRVFASDGSPLAGQEVRILIKADVGVFLVRKTQTAANGTYSFDKLELRDYTLMAVRGNEVANGRARLSALALQDVVDLHFVRPSGRVSGRVIDDAGTGVVAEISLNALAPNAAGILGFREVGTTTSRADGGFSFAGLFLGPFTVSASSFFSPGGASASASGVLSDANPSVDNVTLVLTKNTGSIHGCVLAPDGRQIPPVLNDMGIPLPLSVFITSVRLRDELGRDTQNPDPSGIRVDASTGCFSSTIPLPPDFYTLQVTDDRLGAPTFGLTGQTGVSVTQGVEAEQNIRLLGLGSLRVEVVDAQCASAVEVVDAQCASLPGVTVTVRRTTYPNDVRAATLLTPTDTAPLVFDSLTEGPVSVSALVSTDPNVNVGGREELRGFGGNATGAVIRDGLQVVRVVVDAAGSVSGRFLRTDGVTPVANAQVALTASGRPTAFAVTEVTGAFRFDGIPLGHFSLDGFDPATGRRGRVDGQVQRDGQRVTQDLLLGPLGTVRGVVLDAARATPVAGAEVQLAIAGDSAGSRTVTAGVDGAFVFASVPGGPFTLTAVATNGLSGRATGALESEAQVVEVTVALQGSGRVEGTVFDAAGSPVAAADVTLIDATGKKRSTQTGASGATVGKFSFDTVPLGSLTLEARPEGALTPGDGGRVTRELTSNGQVVSLDVHFQGTISVGVVVTGLVGPNLVEITLLSGGIFGGRAAPTTVVNNVIIFAGIPRAPLTVSAQQITPAGVTISASASVTESDLPAAGGRLTPDLILDLSDVATVQGTVTDPSGSLVSGAKVTLTAGGSSALTLTGGDGTFEFVGIPLDVALRIEASSPQGGRAIFLGRIDTAGRVHDLAEHAVEAVALVLDVQPPTVRSIQPLAGATAVSIDTSIILTFSEAIAAATIRSCPVGASAGAPTILLLESTGTPPVLNDPNDPCDDSNVVPVSLVVSPDGTTVTLTPARALKGTTQHTLSINRGVHDLVEQPLATDVMGTFVTRDDAPPRVVTISPVDGAVNVPGDSLIRITFSEPLARASVNETSVAVSGPTGPVIGRRDLILGDTVFVFTPTDAAGTRVLLASNATYTVTIAGVKDTAGNTQRTADMVRVTFRTQDTVPPAITAVQAPTGARPGETLLVTVTTTDADVTAVELYVDDVLTAQTTQPSAPGEYRFTLVMPAKAITITARAIDSSGNGSTGSAAVQVALVADAPPLVSITAPPSGTVVSPGETVHFVVAASDDLGVAEIRGAASGIVTSTETRPVTPLATSTTVTFTVAVPASAPQGTLTFAAVATDSKGQTSSVATLTLTVQDELDPRVLITAPGDNAVAVPGTPLAVTVEASDDAGVTEITLEVPELDFSQAATVSPATQTATRSFTVPIPDPLNRETLTLTARARDRSNRTGSAQRTLFVLGSFTVESTAGRGLGSDAAVASANIGQTIRLVGQGLTDTLVVRFPTSNDAGAPGTVTAPVFSSLPDGRAASVVVPATVVTGPLKLETATGASLPGTPVLQIVPTIDTFSVPPGQRVEAGVVATITGNGFWKGHTQVEFPGAAKVAASDVTNGNTKLTVTIPTGVSAGELHVSTDGGTSNGFPILGAFGLVGIATQGMAHDPMVASANPGQTIMVTGQALSTSTLVVFSSTDASGGPMTVEAPLFNVKADGTQADVTVPLTAETGVVRLRPTGGEPSFETAQVQIVPTLSSLTVSGDGVFRPGVVATLTGTGFRSSETTVEFPGAAPVTPDSLTRQTLTVTTPMGVTSGEVRVVTDGGVSKGLPVPGDFGLVGIASQGTPANTTEASANVGQIVKVTGEDLSTELLVVLPGVNDDGTATTVEAPLTNVVDNGMSAFVTVPAGAATGPVRLRHHNAAPGEASVFLQIVPRLVSFRVPAGQHVTPGTELTLIGSGFVEGVTDVDFPGAGRVDAGDVFSNGSRLTVTIPNGFTAGTVKVVTPGGASPELQLDPPQSRFVIGGFDLSRANTLSFPEGNLFDQARASLLDNFPQVSFSSFPTLTSEALGRVNTLILTSVTTQGVPEGSTDGFPLTLSATEQSVLSNFVRQGGCAILLVDLYFFGNANESLLDPFGLDSGPGGGFATVTNPAMSPITSGWFGNISSFQQAFPGALANLGPYATGLATTAGGFALAVIEPGKLSASSGPVVIYSDINTFTDSDFFGLFTTSPHEALFLNTISFCGSGLTSDPTAGRIAYWPFDDGTNPTADVTGGHNGNIHNATFTSTDIAPVSGNTTALAFGSGRRVEVVDAGALSFGRTSPVSFVLWLKQTSPSSVYHVFGKRPGCGPYNYQLARDGNLVHFSSSSSNGIVFLGEDFPFAQWTHVAITYDGAGLLKIYVNGHEKVSANNFDLNNENEAPFTIGDSGGCGQPFSGLIDEFQVYNRALTAQEITSFVPPPSPLAVDIASPIEGQEFPRDGLVTISATVSSNYGASQVEFFVNDVSIGVDTTPPYLITHRLESCPSDGMVRIRVSAKNSFDQTSEDSVNVVCRNDRSAVTVRSPGAGDEIYEGALTTFAVDVSDDLGVQYVYFYEGTRFVGIDYDAPYAVQYNVGACPGGQAVTLHAYVYDFLGQVTDGTVTIQCKDPQQSVCGNGVKNPGEQCDGSDLGGATCVSEGFSSGELSCSATCELETFGCTGGSPRIAGYQVEPFAAIVGPRGLTFDADGNLYTVGRDSGTVFKITSDGQVSVFVELGASFQAYLGPVWDAVSGDFFVSRFLTGDILRIPQTGGSFTVFASGLSGPADLTFGGAGNAGDLFVSEFYGGTVAGISPTGTVGTFATGLSEPDGLAFDGNGNLYIGNRGTHEILRVGPSGGVPSVFTSDLPGQPFGITFDRSGNLWVGDFDGGRIIRVAPDGTKKFVGSGFARPEHLRFDPAGVNLYIADFSANVIYKATPVYDLAEDWSDVKNPNGLWSYNSAPGTPITTHWDDWDPGTCCFASVQPAWAAARQPDSGHVPVWFKTISPTLGSSDMPIGTVGMHGSESAAAGVTWTSPINGVVRISGGVWLAYKGNGRSMNWTLFVNGALITGGNLTFNDSFTSSNPFNFTAGSGGTAALTVPVAVGDVINLELVKTSGFAEFVGVDLKFSVVSP